MLFFHQHIYQGLKTTEGPVLIKTFSIFDELCNLYNRITRTNTDMTPVAVIAKCFSHYNTKNIDVKTTLTLSKVFK